MVRLAAEHELLVTVEEGVLPGGFGSASEELNHRRARSRASAQRMPDRNVTHGKPRCCTARWVHRQGDRERINREIGATQLA